MSLLKNNISDNLTATIFDNLHQFFIAPNIFSNLPSAKLNIFERVWSKFDKENLFLSTYLSIGRTYLISIQALRRLFLIEGAIFFQNREPLKAFEATLFRKRSRLQY